MVSFKCPNKPRGDRFVRVNRRLTGISGVGLLCTLPPGLILVNRRLSYCGNEAVYCHPAVIQSLKSLQMGFDVYS